MTLVLSVEGHVGGVARKMKSSKICLTQGEGLFFVRSYLTLRKSECSGKFQRQPIICKVLCSRKRRGTSPGNHSELFGQSDEEKREENLFDDEL
jgi:hypothetical protein